MNGNSKKTDTVPNAKGSSPVPLVGQPHGELALIAPDTQDRHSLARTLFADEDASSRGCLADLLEDGNSSRRKRMKLVDAMRLLHPNGPKKVGTFCFHVDIKRSPGENIQRLRLPTHEGLTIYEDGTHAVLGRITPPVREVSCEVLKTPGVFRVHVDLAWLASDDPKVDTTMIVSFFVDTNGDEPSNDARAMRVGPPTGPGIVVRSLNTPTPWLVGGIYTAAVSTFSVSLIGP